MGIAQPFKIFAVLLQIFLTNYFVTAEVHYEKGVPIVKFSEHAELIGDIKLSRDGRNYSSFMGIPFGTIKHRFTHADLIKDPSWNGQRNAMVSGPSCPQKLPFDGGYINGNELDCLNLNVYVPEASRNFKNDLLPVMVWIHGGGFQFGSGSNYGAKYFMDEDIILVTINYRLGVFGFLSSGDEVVPGNNGLKDQVVALQWVQQNIKRFGGDPSKVTVFGQSAGGASTNFLMLSPTTKGLLNGAISQSGTSLNSWAFNPSPKRTFMNFAEKMKCPLSQNAEENGSRVILECLMEKSVEELNNAQVEFSRVWPPIMLPMVFVPVIEDASAESPFLTEAPIELMKVSKNIPWMVGITEDEGFLAAPSTSELLLQLQLNWDRLLPSSLNIESYLGSPDEITLVSDSLRKFYFKQKTISMGSRNEVVKMYSDAMFNYAIRKAAIETASKGDANVYLYEYAYDGLLRDVQHPLFQAMIGMLNPSRDNLVGHGQDIYTLFNTVDVIPALTHTELIPENSPMEQFSRNMVKLWASFAKSGEPTHHWGKSVDPMWTHLNVSGETEPLKYYKLDDNPGFVTESFGERIEFWDKLWEEHLVNRMLNRKS